MTDLGRRLLGEAESGRTLDHIERFVRAAYPLCRSITGDAVRETFDQMQGLLGDTLPLTRHEVPSGTPVLDWQVPLEWNLRRATLQNPAGRTVIDSAQHNLHVLNYSVPMKGSVRFDELDQHLYSLPDQPDTIPYRTSYYQERWGLCLSENQRRELRATATTSQRDSASWQVDIDTTLEAGALTYAELFLPGNSQEEILFSAHSCHPSLYNDNLSGLSVVATCARILNATSQPGERHFSYRFLFGPGTIGAITWLARNRNRTARVRGGLVAANLGHLADPAGPRFHYKRSRRGDSYFDQIVEQTLRRETSFECLDFSPFGYDERQFCSPGFNLAIGSLTRTPWGQYPEYHTSGDDLSLFDRSKLEESLALYLQIIAALEHSRGTLPEPPAAELGESGERQEAAGARTLRDSASSDGTPVFRNLAPHGEPQLGSRGLYSTLGGGDEGRERQLALLWVLNLSDGRHSLGDIAQRSGIDGELIDRVAQLLVDAELLATLRSG
jgi:aminopeptidase-like protein